MLTYLLLLVAPTVQESEPAHFSCGPFLLQPGQNTMTIVVDHESAVSAQLLYWTADGDAEHSLEHEEPARHHVFTLEDLAPGKVYSYEITSESLSSGIHEFRTLPVRPERYRFLAVGDVRTLPQSWAKVSGRMFEYEPEALFAVGTGDYPSDGRQYSQWITQFFAPARAFLGRTPLWPAIGNHELTRRHDDVTNIENSHYFSLFDLPGNERWYRVDYHLVTLLVLDSNSHMSPGEEQYEWLRAQLRSPRNRFTMVALHHAPLTSGPHGQLQEDGTPLEWPLDEGRRFLVPLFEMYDVDVVLTGHDHLYERSEKDGIAYIVTGGGGAPLYPVNSVENPYQKVVVAAHHYVALDLDADGIELTAIDEDGAEIDSARIPVTERHVERRTRSLTKALDDATVFGPLDPATDLALVTLSNPLDQPLTVEITTASGGNSAEPLQASLEPGERREVPWLVGDVGGDLASEPWRAAVVLDVAVQFAGRDQALDLDVNIARRTTVYQPVYETRRLDSVTLDGVLAEWEGVRAMVADERTPIVRYANSYAGPGDYAAEVRAAWSAGWLHLSADISDETVVDDGVTDIDENDCLRVLFDGPTGRNRTVPYYSFSASGRTDSSRDGTGAQVATRARDGGWILEASIPCQELGLEPESMSDARIACDFLFVDRDLEDGTPAPSYHRLWTSSRSRTDTSTFGSLVLVNEYP